jgi:hypothetical protein
MRALLIVLTVVEIVIFVGVLAIYLVRIARSLRATSELLAKIAFGVRAIEKQAAPVGPMTRRINQQLTGIAGAFGDLAGLAGDRGRGRRG